VTTGHGARFDRPRRSKVLPKTTLLALPLALALTATAAGAGRRAADSLNLHANLDVRASRASCPVSAPAAATCYAVRGSGSIRGLGQVTDRHMVFTVGAVDGSDTACAVVSFSSDVLTVAGKGQIDSAIAVAPGCGGIPTGFTVTGGTGDFAGASGSGTFVPDIVKAGHWSEINGDDTIPDDDDILFAWHADTWSGTLGAPGHTFDLTPPVISGATSRTTTAPRAATRVRVRFTVKARDAVDGPVPVSCRPRSGRLFAIGRTRVTCTATDSSANRATARFTIAVRRHG
jgi:hypothetical protein